MHHRPNRRRLRAKVKAGCPKRQRFPKACRDIPCMSSAAQAMSRSGIWGCGVGGERPRRPELGRLYLILGGLIVGILLTALVGPYLIDWNSFRPNFERYASDVLGQPVRILGDAEVRLLPSPTLTLESIEIGDTEGRPMATVERFQMRVDLLPLIAGDVSVSSLTLDRPQVTVTVDDAGRLDWLVRQGSGSPLDPDRITFDAITINDGTLRYVDVRTGSAFTFAEITTDLFEGASLAGPWRIRGATLCSAEALCGDGVRAAFNLASGRVADDGSLRVTAEVTPLTAGFVGTVRAEGTVRPDEDVLAYAGTLSVDRTDAAGTGTAWSLSGGFRLVPQELALSQFTWESTDGRFALTGDARLALGDDTSFSVTAQSRQIDLDRALATDAPAAMDDAASEIWRWLGTLAVPGIPGDIAITIPSVIASGSVLQEVTLELATGDDGWIVSRFGVQLPGATTFALTDGLFRPGETPALSGTVSLASERPAALATWWHGTDLSGNAMPALFVSGEASLAETAASLHELQLIVGEDVIAGTVDWAAATQDSALGVSALQLVTTTFDYDHLAALGRLLLGGDYALGRMTSRYSVGFGADEIRIGDALASDVVARFVAGPAGITMGELTIDDLDGARIALTGDLISRPDDVPGGEVTLAVDAERLGGVVALAERFAADAPITAWLAERADGLVPLDLTITMDAPDGADTADRVVIDGNANGTVIRADASFVRGLADWAVGDADIVAELDAPDAAALVRQLGLFEPGIAAAAAGAIAIDFTARGVPAGGLTTQFQFSLGGAVISSNGTLQADGIDPPQYAGAVNATGDLGPLAGLLGITMPNQSGEAPAVVDADLAMTDGVFELVISESSSIGERSVAGLLRLTDDGTGWALTGNLDVDRVDTGWLTAWVLGGRALPPAAGESPWSETALVGAMVRAPEVDLDIAVGELTVGEGLTVADAEIALSLSANDARLVLGNGSLGAGQVDATIGVALQENRAVLDGQLFFADYPLEALVWSRDGRPAATGLITRFSIDFSAAGRTPAELVASLSGNGFVEIEQGMLNYMSPDAFDRIELMVDDGAEFTEEVDLRAAFTDFLDAGGLAFDSQQISFTIAGGIIAPEGIISVESDGLLATGNGTIDLNTLTLASNWQLTGVDNAEEGPQPQARISFTGPLAAPTRLVGVAALQSYLSVRRSRGTDIERLEAQLLERQRFERLIARIEADREVQPDEAAAAEPLPAEVLEAVP